MNTTPRHAKKPWWLKTGRFWILAPFANAGFIEKLKSTFAVRKYHHKGRYYMGIEITRRSTCYRPTLTAAKKELQKHVESQNKEAIR